MTARIGIVGGVGWPGTLLYYESLCRLAARDDRPGAPAMTIDSLDMSMTLAAQGNPGDEASWQDFDNLFAESIDRLAGAGCTLAAIASVTPHARFDAISARSSIPVVSILDAVERQLAAAGPGDVLVLGTAVTMTRGLFDRAIAYSGRRKVPTDAALTGDFTTLLDRYFYPGHAAEGRVALMEMIGRIAAGSKPVVTLLGCTDLAPAFPETREGPVFEAEGRAFIDSTSAHVAAILDTAGTKT